ncbi:hypothetical protein YC2023_090126 [Brassica napus]
MAIQCDEKLCHPLGCESIQLWGINEMLMRQIYKQSLNMIVHVTDLVKIRTDSFTSHVFSFCVIAELDKASLKWKEIERSEYLTAPQISCSLTVSDNGRLGKTTSIWTDGRVKLTSPLL